MDSEVISERDTLWLLDELCVIYGFCLPREAHDAIADNPPVTPMDFAVAVFEGEGMNPAEHKKLFAQVHDHIEKNFQRRLRVDQDLEQRRSGG